MLVEICVTSVQSAKNAEIAGAKRVELCSELAVGGITPSYGLIKEVLKEITLPIFVLIRPRGGDFTYSDDEFKIMKADIQLCKELGCKGIVSGVLNADNSIDIERTQELIELSKPLSFTFHRAFDWVNDPIASLNSLIEIGVNRILTSGQQSSAEKGIELLKELKNSTGAKLIILPGGGVNPENVRLFYENGFSEIHASASSLLKEIPKPKISMNGEKFFDETKIYESDLKKIQKLVDIT